MKRLVCVTLALCLLPLVGSVRGGDVQSLAKPNTEGDLWCDLAADHLTPVTRTDFTLTLQMPHLKSSHSLVLESIRYDETAPGNTSWRPLDTAHATVSEGTLTLRIPPFTYYQILRLRTSGQ
jgi:hypothetical protein